MAEECSIGVDTLESLARELTWEDKTMRNSLLEEESENSGSKIIPPEINWPPMDLYENHEKYFNTKVMDIGPLVRDNYDPNHIYGRRWKRKLAAKFVNSSGRTIEILLVHIKRNIHDLTKLFPENPILDDDLSRMLFLDGCAILQFIFSYFEKELKDFNINNGQADLIRQDLFLLGNQIPFRVLNILFNLIIDSGTAHRFRVSVFKFVLGYNITEQMDNYEALSDPEYLAKFYDQHEPVHLLGLLHSIFVYGCGLYKHLSPSSGVSAVNSDTDRPIFDSSYERSFRNVQELKEAGIEVTPSDFNGLNSVYFASKFFVTGQLKFPPLIVDNCTEQKLLNLVAYEMSRDDYESNCWVVSYVNLLDLLIDSEQDVKDLRAARVLRNRLSNDVEVAQLFNKLGSSCSAPPRDEYFPVKNKLQRHYERKTAVWVAQVYHDQFRSPWTVIALIAAFVALLLTGIQTWYAVNPKK